MKIAVITGASSGMGREFVRQLDRDEAFDELWVIARRREMLEEITKEVRASVRVIPLDLAQSESYAEYRGLLDQFRPQVAVLVNCAGYGKFGKWSDIPLDEALGMIDVNCKALVALTQLTLPYMAAGSRIYQLDSLSAFQPVPGLGVYGALFACTQPRGPAKGNPCHAGLSRLGTHRLFRARHAVERPDHHLL